MRTYHYSDMPDEAVGVDAPGTRRRRLNDVESAVSTAMIEVAPGGHTLRHCHPYEHTVFIVEGAGEARDENGMTPLSPGVFLYIRPDELHVIYNTGTKPLKLLTIDPTQTKEKKP
jgi:mannose-6-phosphate isomerase-like protein (cupin superfamily)